MARKPVQFAATSALEEAVRKQAANLDPAQRCFVLAELRIYQWNESRIAALEAELKEPAISDEGTRNLDYEGKLFRQRHQLVAEQSSLFAHIMKWLKGTAAEESALDSFLNG